MKKLYLALLFLVIFNLHNKTEAQSEIWGLNASGGSGFGVLYGMPTGATSPTTTFNFTGNPGSNPQSIKLLEASNGKLYGMTNLGGQNNVGIIFEYDTSSATYVRKVDFTGANGANPKGALIQAANGKLYGMTQFGGANNLGVIFQYDLSTSTYSVLASFTGTSGAVPGSQPTGAFVQPDPTITKLYGLTKTGGVNDKGVIFEFDYGTGIYTDKMDFNGSAGTALGGNPLGQLVKATSASSSTTALFGLASTGGTTSAIGTLFEYDYVANTFTKHVDLMQATGWSPQGSLILASNGRLYGTTLLGGASSSGGVIFEYVISSNTYNKLTDFTTGAGTTGGGPCDLYQASNGKLYGLTRSGGATNVGVVFEYDISNPASPVYTKKVDLASATGSSPFGSLVQVSTGKMYGVTSSGGSVNGGVIFQYIISSGTYNKQIDLNLSSGGNPNGGLVQGTNGKLYGLAAVGGTNSSLGVIFEYDRTTGTYTKKVDLSGNSGADPGSTPFGSMMLASNGKLYGLTSAGGTSGLGTLFSYDPSTNTHAKLIDLTSTNGSVPYGSLAQFTGTGTANGKIYGMTKQGGASGQGVIFEFDPTANTYTKKIDLSLSSANGYSAFGAMVQSNNKLYGMTQLGGANGLGVIFEYDPNTATYTKKVDFTGTSGAAPGSYPFGSLVPSNTVGVLYGMTKTGGVNDLGVIFEYNITAGTYTKKYDMTTANGSLPLGSMILAANGMMYGVTNSGGANSAGVLFQYDVNNVIYTKKIDFTTVGGNYPTYTQLLEVCTKPLTPGSISLGSSTLCQSSAASQSYSIAAVANATAYAWTLPTGAAITSGSTAANITANLSGVAAGTYTLGVAGVNVCGTGTTLSISNITVNALPTVSVNSGSICAGSIFTIIPSGASSYTVQGNSYTVSPSGSASYTVSGTSSAGCVAATSATASVTVNALPTVGVNSGTICSGSSFTMIPTGVVSSTPSGGSLIVSPTSNTLYTIIGRDANNCLSANTATAFVTVNALPNISISGGTMCAGGSVTLSPSGAGTGATYSVGALSGPGPFVVSPASSITYTAAATTSFGCLSANTPTASVTVYNLPVLSVNSPTMCFGMGTVITPSGAGTSGTYTMGALNGAGPFTVNPSASTIYSVSGTTSLGCVSASTVQSSVTVYTLPVISVVSGSICSGSVYTFVPTGASTYTMTGPIVGTSFPVSPSASTSYTIAGTSTNGCVSAGPATANVTVFALPTVSVNSGTVCAGNGFTLNASGGTNYTVLPINTTMTGSTVVTPSATTSYTIRGASAVGCVAATMPVSNVTVIPLPVVSVTSGAVCLGNVFTSTVSGASSYTYITNTATMYPAGPLTLTPVATLTINVIGSNPQGCVSAAPVNMTVVVNPLPTVAITGTNAICDGGTTTLTASGANTYNWGVSTGSALTVSPNTSTAYTVTGTDLNNCSNTATFSLTVNPLPTITVPSGAVCTGNCYTLTPGGASSYTYSSGSSIVCPSTTTSYSITGTSTAGCVSSGMAVATVSVVNILTVTISGNTVICSGSTLSLTANGASTYSWSNGVSTNTLQSVLTASTSYTVMGISGTCSDVATVNVLVNALPTVTALADRDHICVNESVILTAGGASTYTWNAAVPGASLSSTPSVTSVYTVMGTDANGCENVATVIVNVSACTGIAAISDSWEYSLYPNPNNGEFVIESTSDLSVTVINALGQAVLKQELSEGKNQITLNEQAKGIYFVQLKKDRATKIIKIVKQ